MRVKMGTTIFIIMFIFNIVSSSLQEEILRGPPKVEDKPLLLNSYIPAAMQIIAHATELMKYDLRPGGSTTTTTTLRPTPSHKPGLYSPIKPLGPEVYFAKTNAFNEYLQRLKNGGNYFDRYSLGVESREESRAYNSYLPSEEELKALSEIFAQLETDPGKIFQSAKDIPQNSQGQSRDLSLPEDLELFGEGFKDILKEANFIGDYDFVDDEDRVTYFVKKYDMSDLALNLLRKKKIPPTRAYVSLLSLYDLMNKDSKKLGFNKYGGYTQQVLDVLIATSTGTSGEQMKAIFSNLVKNKDTDNGEVLKRVKGIIADLDDPKSYINDALLYIPPLQFS